MTMEMRTKLQAPDLGVYDGPLFDFPVYPVRMTQTFEEREALEICQILDHCTNFEEATVFYEHGRSGHRNPKVRSCHILGVTQALRNFVTTRILESVKPHIVNALGYPQFSLHGHAQFLRYSVREEGGDHFVYHADAAIHVGRKWVVNTPERHLTFTSYLNSNFKGGKIQFQNVVTPDGNLWSYAPEPGTTLLFPSDPRFVHRVTPVEEGTRYAVVGWLTLKTTDGVPVSKTHA